MSAVTFNGQTVVRGTLLLKLRGNWCARLDSIDLTSAPAEGSAVTLFWLGTTLRGYVLHAGESEGIFSAYVVGGAGGLARDLPAKAYGNTVAVSLVLSEILREAGETLSTTAKVSGYVSSWPRFAGPAADALEALARSASASWRMLPDGSLWWGSETWPAGPRGDYQVQGRYPDTGTWILRPDVLVALPGSTLEGQRVGDVEYSIGPEKSRAKVFLYAEEDPLRAGLQELVREQLGAIDTLALYPGQIVKQHADGSVDAVPDSARVRFPNNIPLRGPCHGAKLSVPAGSRCVLGFAGGDPLQPFAALWEPGAGGKAVGRVGDKVKVTLLYTTATVGMGGATVVTALGAGPLSVDIEGTIQEGSPHLSLLPGSTV